MTRFTKKSIGYLRDVDVDAFVDNIPQFLEERMSAHVRLQDQIRSGKRPPHREINDFLRVASGDVIATEWTKSCPPSPLVSSRDWYNNRRVSSNLDVFSSVILDKCTLITWSSGLNQVVFDEISGAASDHVVWDDGTRFSKIHIVLQDL